MRTGVQSLEEPWGAGWHGGFLRRLNSKSLMANVATRIDLFSELAKRILLSKISLLRINLFREAICYKRPSDLFQAGTPHSRDFYV
jgi:hypothetical protein